MSARTSHWRGWNLVAVCVVAMNAGHAAAQSVIKLELSPFTEVERTRFVKAHNAAREAVGVSSVKWSDELATFATEWLQAQSDKMQDQSRQGQIPNPGHRPAEGRFRQRYGENLALWGGTSSRVSLEPEAAVTGWLKEKAAWDKLNETKPYTVGDEQGKTDETGQPILVGHYTQVVWKSTQRIGAARLVLSIADEQGHVSRKYVVVVCNYDPPGNILGLKPY